MSYAANDPAGQRFASPTKDHAALQCDEPCFASLASRSLRPKLFLWKSHNRGNVLLLYLVMGLLYGCTAVSPPPSISRVPSPGPPLPDKLDGQGLTSPPQQQPVVEAMGLDSASLIPNFHIVHPWLWRGAAPTDAGIRKLQAAGVVTVIDLRISPKKVRAERKRVEALGMQFINLPMSGDPPTSHEIETFLRETTAPNHPRIFVHCQHGADRTGTMVGLYRERVDGWAFDHTYREMRRFGFNPHWKRLKATVQNAAQPGGGRYDAGTTGHSRQKISSAFVSGGHPTNRPESTKFVSAQNDRHELSSGSSPGDRKTPDRAPLASTTREANATDAHRNSPDYAIVMVWHDVVPKRQVWFDTPTALFRAQLVAIRRAACHVLTLESFLRHLTEHTPLPPRPLVLTFDDNNRGLYENAFPLLKQFGYPAALFVHTDYVGVSTSKAHCTWEQLRTMQHSGLITVQSLTASHPPDLRRLSDTDITHELQRSRAAIEQHLGTPVYAFVYPEDRHDARVARLVEAAGYRIGFTEDWGNAATFTSRMRVHRYSILKRFDQALTDLKRAWPTSQKES